MSKRLTRALVLLAAVGLSGACGDSPDGVIEGRPGGPYRLVLTMDPATPVPGEETWLAFGLTYANGKPVTDLQVAHERLIHNFIVARDFSSFAHIHHEDFAPLTEAERHSATVRFPYRFPRAGRYRIVSEFAHRDRSWIKHFDVTAGDPATVEPAAAEPVHEHVVAGFRGVLDVTPAQPLAGHETDLRLRVTRDGAPVTNLALYLGTELHGAVWRDDGRFFGHMHSYTPQVAAIMALAHDRDVPAAARGTRIAEMMVQLMCLESELVFPGPEIPLRYVFPEGGRYHAFLQVAPGGEPVVFHFVIDVAGQGA